MVPFLLLEEQKFQLSSGWIYNSLLSVSVLSPLYWVLLILFKQHFEMPSLIFSVWISGSWDFWITWISKIPENNHEDLNMLFGHVKTLTNFLLFTRPVIFQNKLVSIKILISLMENLCTQVHVIFQSYFHGHIAIYWLIMNNQWSKLICIMHIQIP